MLFIVWLCIRAAKSRAPITGVLLILTMLLVLYSVVGSVTWRLRGELYPLFPWDLFSFVPNVVTDYGMRVVRVNDQPLPSPTYFEELTNTFPDAQSLIASNDIQQLGAAIDQNDEASAKRLQTLIAERYFAGVTSVQYEVVRRTWRPLDRYRQRTYISEQTLATFDARS